MPAKGTRKKRGDTVPKKKGRNPFFLFFGSGNSKSRNGVVRKPVTETSKKKKKTHGQTGRQTIVKVERQMVPDVIHWMVTVVLIAVVSVGAYYIFLRPYFYRWRPCQGTKEYGVCMPSGFLYYGIDISHHQGRIDWKQVASSSAESGYPIKFAIMKATEGSSFTDPEYIDNISDARAAGFVCGVYHFYDPDASPDKQAEHYINTVKLQKGDFVPVVDVERSGRSSGDLQRELLVFLKTLETHYGAKPIIYASAKFRKRHLDIAAFDAYPFWVAHYYVARPATDKRWLLWQFTDHASVKGIDGYTDFNVFKGSVADFNSLLIR